MTRLLSAITAAVLALSSGVPVAAAYAWDTDSQFYGNHPYETREPRLTRSGYYFMHYSDWYIDTHPDRSVTHALHPYFREAYYDSPLTVVQARKRCNNIRLSPENAYVPRQATMASCGNYSYAKPNYRVPPYEYDCQG
ncbi:TPA: hypothetical protein DCL30_00080 [Candidatus Peribacteria bacterium]|nr:MAG: hypothetical protein A3J91_04680 [Candidatus Peribacteria bacterium RIFOXYC2_FULL_58_10]OGJ84368.1 MAG: hypothetical protein A2529_03155 [Candidatus Peribacteria bacterium RIFOXYD2_FULL_58_15]HAI97929.1 hypothetical protein [Candidatus Peribacteria bacterium]HAS34705.1 hypothetical protein [Candidatus Peribacteria bacterium]